MVKNPPANAGDMGSIPGPGRSHMKLSPCTTTTEPALYSLRATTTEACAPQLLKPVRLEPVLRNKRSHHNEKPAHRNKE